MKSLTILFLFLFTVNCNGETKAPNKCDLKLSDGKSFKCQELQKGRWVVSFFFGNCKNICPLINAKIQSLYPHANPQTNFLSVTVDPNNDRGKKFSDIKKKWADKKPQWKFLTGEPKRVFSLIKDGFKLEGGGYPFVHSEQVMIFEDGVKVSELSLLDEGEYKKIKSIIGSKL